MAPKKSLIDKNITNLVKANEALQNNRLGELLLKLLSLNYNYNI